MSLIMVPQLHQTLKRIHPDNLNKMPPLGNATDEYEGMPVPKRAREEIPLRSDRVPPKKRRVSLPPTTTIDPPLITTIRLSKSCTALKNHVGMSPVELLRRFQLEQTNSKMIDPNSPTFIKPTEKAVAAYDATIVNAVRSANLDALRAAHKESLNACNQFGESLLHMACRRGNVEVVRYMVEEAKVNVHVRDDYGRTVLHDATWTARPNKDVMEVLLKAVTPEMLLAQDVRGHTPFDYARKEHWAEWVTFLSERLDRLVSPQV
jgi:Ankyrin repeats (3 copies)